MKRSAYEKLDRERTADALFSFHILQVSAEYVVMVSQNSDRLMHELRIDTLMRHTHPGNCFYTCFAYAMIHQLLTFNDRPMHHFVVKHLEKTLE